MGARDQNPPIKTPNIYPTNTRSLLSTESQGPPSKRCEVFNIATLNVRTLRTQESLTELDKALENIKFDILGISEMRRLGEKIEEYGNYILFQKGKTPGQKGVGFIIKKSLKQHVQELIGISERLALLIIKLPGYKKLWSIMQVYAPTEQAEQSVIDSFYEEISLTVRKNSDKHIIIMGDFNAQVGAKQNNEEYVLGKFGYGKRSPNGQKLTEFLMEHNLTLLNSTFKKNKKNKWTWTSPDGMYKNEIDYMISNYPKAFTDTTVISAFNFNTNHRMVRSSLRKYPNKNSRKHIKNYVSEQFRADYNNYNKNKIDIEKNTGNDTTGVREKYNILEKQMKKYMSANRNQEDNKYQLSDRTLKLINERKELISNQIEKENIKLITEISKEIRKNIRNDRKTKRLQTIEFHITRTGGIKKALNELKETGKEWIPRLKKGSKSISIRKNIKDLATDFYRQLYAKQKPSGLNEQSCSYTDMAQESEEESLPSILPTEVKKAIESQKMGKAPGPDKITNELMKGTMDELVPALTKIFNEILVSGHIPEQWTESHIILLYKKGDKEDIGNYRPISLMSNVYKVFAKIILNRITKMLDEQQPTEQAGFRKGFSTIDHIYTVKQVIEKYKEYNKVLYIAFIDYAKAFDSIEHEHIWETLKQQGIQTKYASIIKTIYTNSKARIQLESLGNEFNIERGVRQGDPLSPKLFSAVLENILRKLDWEKFGLNINGSKLNHLRFADDLVLFEENPENLEIMIQGLNRESLKVGLKMNTNKTKLITNSTERDIKIGQEKLEYVKDYIYLGQVISTEEQNEKEIKMRIAIGWRKYWALKEIMKSKDLGMAIKRKTFNTCILPCLIYGCETWALTKSLREKLAICQRAMERSMIGIRRKDRVRSSVLRSKTKLTDILKQIDQQKWRWAGHMVRDAKEKWSKKISEWYPRDGKRKRGRPTMKWEDDLKLTVGATWRRVANDRSQWKSLEEAYAKRHTEIRDIL